MENLSGSVIKGYELHERIGAGGFGAVYKAHQGTVGRDVAIKIILPHFANHPDFIRRFETEAQLVARLEHLHIVPLYDYWRDPDGAYLVMRWLKGGNLREALHASPFDIESSALLLDQVASALATAHRNHVIHRDLKPGNILLDEDGNAYLADFGIAKDLSEGKSSATGVDAIVGSPDYLSPEQARSEQVTPQTDIYSLGVVLYEILTGQHPFPNLSAVERLYKHLSDPLPLINNLPAETQDGVNSVIQKATAKNPAHRYDDVLVMAAAFHDAIRLSAPQNVVETLTPREQEILQQIIAGRSNKEIAQDLYITVMTVKWYITQIYRKLNVRSRVQAIVRARELNLIVNESTPVGTPSLTGLTAIPTEQFHPDNPYKGLRAFQTADYRDFFGREKLIDKLLKRMGEKGEMSRFLAVIGPSGSGKSSLVKAGLIPAFWSGELPGSEKWFIAEMLPGSHPLDELEIALTRVAANPSANLREQLERDERGLLRAAQLILPNDGSELAVVIDQFEEVFTLVQDEATRMKFLNLLNAAVTDTRSRVRVVITLRADFYDRPLQYPDFGELVRSRMETVLPLSADGLERAIARPAEQVGVTFEPGLVASIVAEVNYQAGALPLLQYALTELFERREGRTLTQAAYAEIGGAGGALAKRAEEVYQEFMDEGKEAIRQMFLRLVTLGEGVSDTRRRVARSELLGIAADTDMMDEAIDTFAAYRLLSLDNDPGTRSPTVEVAHEAILKEWERLRNWINDSREDIRMQQLLANIAEEWLDAGKDVSFLASGLRLEQFEKWAQTTSQAMTPLERAYLEASLNERARQAQAETERQQREARLERRSHRFLRMLVGVFALAAVVAAGLSLVALNLGGQAVRSAAEFRSIALSSGAQQALDDGQPDVALALAREAVSMDNPPSQSELMFFQAATSNWIRQRFVGGHTGRVFDAVFHPDGKRMMTSGWDGRTIMWDIATGKQLQSLEFDGLLTTIAFHPDGHLAAIGTDSLTLLWNLETNIVKHLEAREKTWNRQPLFNRYGTRLLTSSQDGTVYIWDVATLELIRSLRAHGYAIPGMGLNQDETLLITTGLDCQVHISDFETGELLQILEHGDSCTVNDAYFLPDGERVLSSDSSGQIFLWNWRSGEIIWRAENPSDVQDIALSPDATLFITGSNDPDNDVRLWEVETGNLIREYHGHTQRVQNVDFSPDGTMILSASNDGTAILWPLIWDSTLSLFTVPGNEAMAVHPSEPLIAISDRLSDSDYSALRLVNTETGQVIRTFDEQVEAVVSLAFSPDGRLLVSSHYWLVPGTKAKGYIWDVETGEQLAVLEGHTDANLTDIAFSPDSHIVAIGEDVDGLINLWYVETAELIHVLEGHRDWLNALTFSPDGRTLYSGSRDGDLFQWDVQTGQFIRAFAGHAGEINDLDVTADGHWLVSASSDQTARLWDTTTGEPFLTLQGHKDYLSTAQFSPNQHIIVTGSMDGTVILWDAATGERLRRYVAYQPGTWVKAAFSADGQTILSAGSDQIIVWDAAPLPNGLEAWVRENRYIAEFTCAQRALYHIEPLCAEQNVA